MGRSREYEMRAPSKIKINVVVRTSPVRSLARLLPRGLPTPLVRLAVPTRMLSEYSAVCRFPLSVSHAFPISVAHNCTSAYRDAHIHAHQLVPLFPSLPLPIFLILLFPSFQSLFQITFSSFFQSLPSSLSLFLISSFSPSLAPP